MQPGDDSVQGSVEERRQEDREQRGSGEKSVVEDSEGSLPPGQGSRVVEGAEGSAAQSPVSEEEEIGLGGIGL